MSKSLILALSILTVLTSCHKRDESELNKPCFSGCAVFNIRVGTGINSATPVGGAHVDLVWQEENGIFGGGGSSIDIAKGYTNAEGVINVKFKAFGNEFTNGYFTVNVTGPSNYIASYRPLFGIHNADTTLNTSVHLPSVAYLKIIFKNYDPVTSGDAFGAMPSYDTYGSEPSVSGPINFQNTSFFSGLHPFASATYMMNTAGNQYTHIPVALIRNSVKINLLDSLYIPAGAIGTYTVDYQSNFQ
jgi:hypothetical protein